MPESDERSPLLAATGVNENDAAADHLNESSPLLSNQTGGNDDDNDRQDGILQAQTKDESQRRRKRRWPSFIAIIILASLVVVVMVLGFLVPPAVQQYVENAVVIEPTSLSVESLTADGLRARIQATFRLDGSRVADENARRIGRAATSIMRQIGAEETKVRVHLPHYDNSLLGTAVVPPIILNLVDGQVTNLDFIADVVPGDTAIMQKIANQWLKGDLDRLKVTGATALSLKSGFIPLGTHDVVESMVFEANELPSMPEYKITNLAFHDVPLGDHGEMGVGSNVTVVAYNDYPVGGMVPSLGFEVLVPNCESSEPNINVASAITSNIQVKPKSDVTVEAEGLIRELPEPLTKACPQSELSPLDNFMQRYLHGEDAEVFVRGKAPDEGDLPGWIGEILESITVPVQFPGRSLDNFLRNYSFSDVDFKLPSPFADPNDPNSKPRVSGTVNVLAALPADLNIDIQVNSLRAQGDLFYQGEKFGKLNIKDWQKAKSNIIHGSGDEEDMVSITSRVNDAPIDITDGSIFSDIMQELLFGDADIVLDVKSTVDVQVQTVLGKLVLRGVPAKGKVPVKHVPGDLLTGLNPQVGEVHILNTSTVGLRLQGLVNVTNPTPYTATIPYINIHILEKENLIGEAIVKDMQFRKGNNTDILAEATWDPTSFGGKEGRVAAQRLLSEYLSGKNTSITLRAHRDSIPSVPVIGEALSRINMTLPTPRLNLPDDDDDDGDDDDEGKGHGQGFIRDATFHILSSTATFTLASPLRYDTVHIERINATAYYNHSEPVGQILYDEPFAIPPGLSRSPKLPVDWSTDHVGFDKLKEALGGTLKLDALADVTIRLDHWIETVNYEGKGIGARVSL